MGLVPTPSTGIWLVWPQRHSECRVAHAWRKLLLNDTNLGLQSDAGIRGHFQEQPSWSLYIGCFRRILDSGNRIYPYSYSASASTTYATALDLRLYATPSLSYGGPLSNLKFPLKITSCCPRGKNYLLWLTMPQFNTQLGRQWLITLITICSVDQREISLAAP